MNQEELAEYIRGKIRPLQANYLAEEQHRWAPAAATLAKLRRVVDQEPGADPAVWDVVFGGWPGATPKGDLPTSAEYAAHAALALYATHQQSKRTKGMHRRERSMGLAVRDLDPSGEKPGVRRRFDMLVTAGSFAERLHHARGLVTMLRGVEITLDYGQLAADLMELHRPDRADRVRLRWARDFNRPIKPAEEADTNEGKDQP